MIVPANHAFKLIRGAQFDFRFEYLLGTLDSKVPVDLTGYQGIWTITSPDKSQTYMKYSTGNIIGTSGVFFGGDDYNTENGIIDLIIVSLDTEDLPWQRAAYYLTLISPTQERIPILRGNITIADSLPC